MQYRPSASFCAPSGPAPQLRPLRCVRASPLWCSAAFAGLPLLVVLAGPRARAVGFGAYVAVCCAALIRAANDGAISPGSARRLRAAGLLVGAADVAYALRRDATARYPYNYAPDLAYLAAAALLAWAVWRPWPRGAALWTTGGCLAASCGLQVAYVLRPMAHLGGVGPAAVALAAAYSLAVACAGTQLLRVATRLHRPQAIVGSHGLLLMLAADWLCRHAALLGRNSQGQLGEGLWLAGLGLFAASLHWPRDGAGTPPWPAVLPPCAPWRSVRALLGAALSFGCLATLLASCVLGWLPVGDGRRLGALACAFVVGSLAANLLAAHTSRWLRRGARLQARGADASARALHELRRLVRAHRRHRRLAHVAAEAAHDLRGPLRVLRGAGHNARLPRAALAELQHDAVRRIEASAARLLGLWRRLAAEGPARVAPEAARGAAPPPAGPPRPRGAAVTLAAYRAKAPPSAPRGARAAALVNACRQALLEARLRHPVAAGGTRLVLRLGTGRSAAAAARALGPDPLHAAWSHVRATPPRASLLRALAHLIDNALQAASGPGGVVVLHLTVANGTARLRVRDRGAGIERVRLRRLGRGPIASPKPQGSGLGVWQVAQWARQYGVGLKLASAPRVGTDVTLTLPLVRRAAYPVVLLDDDALVRRAWCAGLPPARVHAFAHVRALVCALGGKNAAAPTSSPADNARWADADIYVDERLGPTSRGREVRRALRGLGYAWVFVTPPDKGWPRLR